MTREDAFEIWLPIIKMGVKSMPECSEALDMAIKALKQEPCADAISRQAAIDACLNGWNKDYKEIVEEIRALPPVTPAEKVGQWEWNQYDSNPKIGNWHCSQCHGIGKSYYDYCPYCKAKMSASPTGAERSEE